MGPDSPPLEPVKFNPGASPEPVPTPPRPAPQPEKGSDLRKRRPVQPTQSDAVIISFLGNHNFPDIAQRASENPLDQGSTDGENEASSSSDMNEMMAGPDPVQLRNAAEHALLRQDSMEGRARSQSKSSAPLDMIMNSHDNNHIPRPRLDTSDQALSKTSIGKHMLPPVPALSTVSTEPPSALRTPDSGQSLPPLRNLTGSLAASDRKLPPLPPQAFQSPSSGLQSPTADLAALRFSSSKPLTASTPSSAFPNSATSPPGTSHRISPPRNFVEVTMSPPTAHPSVRGVPSPQTESTPSSLYSAAYQSPRDSVSSPEHIMQIDLAGTMRPMLPLPTAPGMSPGVVFRCKVSGCTAPPFQTQYLLNSHMNVHSSARPHYCPRKGCPRSEGGKGFKRKNEMIRHGLVHQSPGYACPFCPDREHKYPRPDNLQRHVKVHHVDKDKDDPVLREVLNQRIDGGSRGRRKRANS